MTAIAIQIKTACARCGENIPVNGIVAHLACPRCREAVELDVTTWKRLLEAPALDGPRAEPEKQNVSTIEVVRPFMRIFTRQDAKCARCGAVLAVDAELGFADRGWFACVACGDRVSIRALPGSLGGLGGVTHVVGEVLEAPNPPSSNATGEVVTCAKCGAAVPFDASSSRALHCGYCGASVLVPDAIWQRLHPAPTQRVFYLRHDPSTHPGGAGDPILAWGFLDDAIVGPDGNLYLVGGVEVCSYDGDLTLRWRAKTTLKGSHAGEPSAIAATPHGELLVWRRGKHPLLVLSCADGATVATLGGVEADDASTPEIDLERCDDLIADVDGTILALLHNRVVRWSRDGGALETWPAVRGLFGARHQKLKPLFRHDAGSREPNGPELAASLSEVGGRPIEMDTSRARMGICADGSVVIRQDQYVAKMDRQGARTWLVEIPGSGATGGRPCSDRDGNLYVLCWLRDSTGGVVCISPDGADVRLLIDGGKVGTPIRDDHHLAVLPNGTILVLDAISSARVFNRAGALVRVSDKARKADETYAARR